MRQPTCLTTAALAILLCLPAGLLAQNRNTANTLKLDEKATSPPATLADVAWIAGQRRAEAWGGIAEEVWSPPLGNSMVGMFRLVKDGKVAFYELMTIVLERNSLALKIKHFNPDLSGWEEKSVAQTFPLVKLTPNEAFFVGQTFRRAEDGALRVFVTTEQKDGATGETEFYFKLVK